MSDINITTPEGRAELRTAVEAVGKHARWNWDRIEETFYVHEHAWDVAAIRCGDARSRTSDSERMNIERRIATFIAAADPDTVYKLLDALDRVEARARAAETKLAERYGDEWDEAQNTALNGTDR